MEHNEKKNWSFSTFRGGRGPGQGREIEIDLGPGPELDNICKL